MSHEDIIKHIIRDIGYRASIIFKAQRALHNQAALESQSTDKQTPDQSPDSQHQNNDDEIIQLPPPAPHPPLMQESKNLFATGIKSHSVNLGMTVVSETLSAFMVRAVVLDPRNEFKIDRELTRDEVERLIKLSVEKITTLNNPMIETVKMQVYFDTNFPAQADFLHREKIARINTCLPTLREITESKAKNVPAYEALYRKIVSYVLLKSHVGNPTDMRVVRDTTAALESVFPQSELSTFVNLSRSEKEVQLNGMSQLVTGIRLFNRQLGKGGDTIENVPQLCIQELQDLLKLITKHTETTEQLIQQYVAIIDYVEKTPKPDLGAGPGITPAQLKAISNETEPNQKPTTPENILSLTRLKSALVFRRQLLMYLDTLHEQVIKSGQTVTALGGKFDECVNELKNTCRSKVAVPVDQVYPQFILLASLWTNWLDELFLIAFRRGIMDTLEYHIKSFSVQIPSVTARLSESYKHDIEPEILGENEIISKASELMAAINVINRAVEVVHPGNTTQYFKLPVEYGGFCPHTVIRRDGLILPGDKNIGLLRYRDRLFTLANMESAREFAKFPDRYIEGIMETAKRNPDLVQLLHLYQYFPTVDALEKAKSFTKQRLLGRLPLVAEIGTQVDTHIIDTKIDPKYQWNEWDLRRKGLMLVNLKNKKTHSVQTNNSHFRRESESQHYAPKSTESQTMTSSSSNVPRRVTYLAGLRHDGNMATKNIVPTVPLQRIHGVRLPTLPNAPRSKFRVVDLTVDL